jgi:hypothetical protein
MPTTKTGGPQTPGSKRQMEYVARLEAKGYSRLTAVFVPRVLIPEIREMIKKRVKKWEKETLGSL